jgi:hypothetical protein
MKKQTRKFISGGLAVVFALSLSVGSGFKQVKAIENRLPNSDRASIAKELDRLNSEINYDS